MGYCRTLSQGQFENEILFRKQTARWIGEVRRQHLESEKQIAATKMIVWINEINVDAGRKI